MGIKRFLLIISIFLLVVVSVSCASSKNAVDELQAKRELTQELWQALMDYNLELAGVEAIRQESYDQINKALTEGTIDTIKFRKRAYQITLIEANTIKFIDSKPQYVLLHQLMWDERKAPSLAWATPELESDSEGREAEFEQYLQGYIARHYDTVDTFCQFLKKQAKELDIELNYTPKL